MLTDNTSHHKGTRSQIKGQSRVRSSPVKQENERLFLKTYKLVSKMEERNDNVNNDNLNNRQKSIRAFCTLFETDTVDFSNKEFYELETELFDNLKKHKRMRFEKELQATELPNMTHINRHHPPQTTRNIFSTIQPPQISAVQTVVQPPHISTVQTVVQQPLLSTVQHQAGASVQKLKLDIPQAILSGKITSITPINVNTNNANATVSNPPPNQPVLPASQLSAGSQHSVHSEVSHHSLHSEVSHQSLHSEVSHQSLHSEVSHDSHHSTQVSHETQPSSQEAVDEQQEEPGEFSTIADNFFDALMSAKTDI